MTRPLAPPRRIRRWFRWLLALPFLFAAASVLQVAVLRFVDPPFSAFMAARLLEAWGSGDFGFRVAYDWRDLDKMAPSLPLSMVAAEDQNFATHHGFDLDAIEKARVHNRKMVERAEKRGRPVTRLRGASSLQRARAGSAWTMHWPVPAALSGHRREPRAAGRSCWRDKKGELVPE